MEWCLQEKWGKTWEKLSAGNGSSSEAGLGRMEPLATHTRVSLGTLSSFPLFSQAALSKKACPHRLLPWIHSRESGEI